MVRTWGGLSTSPQPHTTAHHRMTALQATQATVTHITVTTAQGAVMVVTVEVDMVTVWEAILEVAVVMGPSVVPLWSTLCS